MSLFLFYFFLEGASVAPGGGGKFHFLTFENTKYQICWERHSKAPEKGGGGDIPLKSTFFKNMIEKCDIFMCYKIFLVGRHCNLLFTN